MIDIDATDIIIENKKALNKKFDYFKIDDIEGGEKTGDENDG